MKEDNNSLNEIGKVLSGEGNAPLSGSEFNEMKQIWDLAGDYKYPEDSNTDKAWEDLQSRIAIDTSPLQVSWVKRNLWAVAASFALLIVAGGGIWYMSKPKEMEEVASILEQTGNKQFKTIHLSDGSIIKMNANSKITIAAGFNSSNRNVVLQGQATFEVAHNEKIPFLVTAAKTTTQVVGTGFDISAFEGENIKIQVLHGKVKFGVGSENLLLTKGQAAKFDSKNDKVSLTKTNAADLAWQNENWIFKAASLEDIAAQIKHSLGKSLVYESKYATKQFTGKFNKNTSAEEIAKTISQALQIAITVE